MRIIEGGDAVKITNDEVFQFSFHLQEKNAQLKNSTHVCLALSDQTPEEYCDKNFNIELYRIFVSIKKNLH